MSTAPERSWQLPWLRVSLVLSAILHTRWDAATWPTAKAELKKALLMRTLFRQAGWFN